MREGFLLLLILGLWMLSGCGDRHHHVIGPTVVVSDTVLVPVPSPYPSPCFPPGKCKDKKGD